MNASIGTRGNKSGKKFGPHGINNRKAKGVEAVNLLRMHAFYAPLTFTVTRKK